jgi:hypothetical protein
MAVHSCYSVLQVTSHYRCISQLFYLFVCLYYFVYSFSCLYYLLCSFLLQTCSASAVFVSSVKRRNKYILSASLYIDIIKHQSSIYRYNQASVMSRNMKLLSSELVLVNNPISFIFGGIFHIHYI